MELLSGAEQEGIGMTVPMASGLLSGAMTRERIAALPADDRFSSLPFTPLLRPETPARSALASAFAPPDRFRWFPTDGAGPRVRPCGVWRPRSGSRHPSPSLRSFWPPAGRGSRGTDPWRRACSRSGRR
ncbi:MAG TPA: hypothetical protein DD490_30900 [Acidobacteria bacterium]|nr:hypothetical protein [Acidobacteriota bacterium]